MGDNSAANCRFSDFAEILCAGVLTAENDWGTGGLKWQCIANCHFF